MYCILSPKNTAIKSANKGLMVFFLSQTEWYIYYKSSLSTKFAIRLSICCIHTYFSYALLKFLFIVYKYPPPLEPQITTPDCQIIHHSRISKSSPDILFPKLKNLKIWNEKPRSQWWTLCRAEKFNYFCTLNIKATKIDFTPVGVP